MLSPDRIAYDVDPARRGRRRLRRGAPRHRAISATIGASSRRSRPLPTPPASRRPSCIICSAAGPGLTPKAFLQALTLDSARQLLRDSASVLDATYEVGLSGPGRLHDLFVTHEAMSPGEWKSGGEGLTITLRLPPFALRQGAGHGDRARARRPRLRRCRRGEGGARRHDAAAGRRRPMSRTPRAPRRSRAASSIRRSGGRISRCAWC